MFWSLELVMSLTTSTQFHSVASLLWPLQITVILYITFPHPPHTEPNSLKVLSELQTGNMLTGRETWWSWLWYPSLSMVVIFPANRSLPELLWQQWSMFLFSLIEWVQTWPWAESEEQPCIQRSGAAIWWTRIHINYRWRDRQERLRDTLCCRMFCPVL